MKNALSRRLWVFLSFLLASWVTQASNVTFQFSGTIGSVYSGAPLPSSLSGLSTNTVFSGSYTFDTGAVGIQDDFWYTNPVMYYNRAITAFMINIGGVSFSLRGNSTGLLMLTNDNPYLGMRDTKDRYKINTGGNLDDDAGGSIGVDLVLVDNARYSGAATDPFDPQLLVLPDGLDSSNLSDIPPEVARFDAAWISIFSTNNGKVAASGPLYAVTLPASSIPEPSTLLLSSLALLALRGVMSRKNKQDE